MSRGVSLYEDKNGFLHNVDARAKLLWMLVSFALVLLLNNPFYVGAVYVVNIGLGIASKMSMRAIRNVLSSNLLLMVLTIVLWPVYLQAGPLLFTVFGVVKVTRTALLYAFAVGFRLVTMVTTSTVFIMTTPIYKLIAAMQQLRLPSKVCLTASMMIRFIPVIRDEGMLIVEAQKSRGLDLESGSIVQKVRKYAPISIPLFLRSFSIAQKLSLAMDSRAWGITDHPTPYLTLKMDLKDKVFTAFWALVLLVGILGRVLGFGLVITTML